MIEIIGNIGATIIAVTVGVMGWMLVVLFLASTHAPLLVWLVILPLLVGVTLVLVASVVSIWMPTML